MYKRSNEETVNLIGVSITENLDLLNFYFVYIWERDYEDKRSGEPENVPLVTPTGQLIVLTSPDLVSRAFEESRPDFHGFDPHSGEIDSVLHLRKFLNDLDAVASAYSQRKSSGSSGVETVDLEERADLLENYHDFSVAYILLDCFDAVNVEVPASHRATLGYVISHLACPYPLSTLFDLQPVEYSEVRAAFYWAIGALIANCRIINY